MPNKFLSWGIGIQSTTLLAMSALGELEPLDAAITADTHWERRETYRLRDWYQHWAEDHDVRVEIVSAGDIRVDGDESNGDRLPLQGAGVQASALYLWQGLEPLATANLAAAARRERTAKKVPLFICTGTHCWT